MAARSVITGRSIPGATGVSLLARLRGNAGQLVTQASLSSITYTVSDLTNGTTLGTGTFTISSTVYDSLQQGDPRWTADSASRPGADGSHGFNFLATLPASLFTTRTVAAEDVLAGERAPAKYQADVKFTPTSGEVFRVAFRWSELVVYG